MKRIRSVVFDMNAHVLKLKLGCIQDVQAHFMEFKALIWVLEKSYDVILKCKEKASYAYLDSCLEDASYDNYDSSFSVDGDASSLCDHDISDVCSSVSSPPCVEGRGNVCIWDFDHMDGPVKSICGRPMVDMDSMPVFDVYDDDEGAAPIGDMIMSDMPIWDVESSQEEEPYVDMDAFMAMNAAKAEEEICVMESECEEVESSMWEAMDTSNASTHVSQDLKEVADVDDWLPEASPMCVWLPMDGPIVVDTDSSCDDASSYDMADGTIWDADLGSDYACGIDLTAGASLDCDQKVACSQSDDYGICVVDDKDCDWGFDDPQVEMDEEMQVLVCHAMSQYATNMYNAEENNTAWSFDSHDMNALCWNKFGTPLEIISDRGPGFRGDLVGELMKKMGIKRRHSSPYYPQCNGSVEKVNGMICKIITKHVGDKAQKRDLHLNAALWAYRTSFKASLGEGSSKEKLKQTILALEKLELDREEAILHYISQAEKRRQKFNKKLKTKDIEEKSLVLWYDNKFDLKKDGKFVPHWEGPSKVVKIFDNSSYQLMNTTGKLHKTRVNGWRLKPYFLQNFFDNEQWEKET
ncbi:hypothetical protein L7F22_052372 [Adiantum nelumboides]|nr:hypothetical protein [Adiantum nelumboides]